MRVRIPRTAPWRQFVSSGVYTFRVRLTKGLMIAGRPASEVRSLLRRGSGNNIGAHWTDDLAVSVLNLTRKEAVALHDDLARLGFISLASKKGGERAWRLTANGSALCMASAAPPIKRAAAERMLSGLLDRVSEVNHSPTYLLRVSRLAVFGSYLSDAAELGDLDILYELAARNANREEHTRQCYDYSAAAQCAGRIFKNFLDFLSWPQTEINQFLRSRQRISLHEWSEAEGLREMGAVIRELNVPG